MDTVSGIGVLDKVVVVLAAVADGPQALTELQATTGLPRATAHRLAAALEAHGWLRRDGDGRYELGLALAHLGRLAGERFSIAELARPVLADLRDRTGESVQLFVRDGDRRRCVLSLQSPHALRWIVPEGALLPLDAGSAGRVLLGDAAVVASVEEREPGVASVSAAVVDATGVVVAAVSVSGPVERLTRQPARRYGSDVETAAATLTELVADLPPGGVRT
jgi:DNA-binding IclR family transcriptional regulator